MNENMVEIDKNEYESILEFACKAAMLKEAMLNTATLYYSKEIYFGCSAEVATIFKYAFPEDCEKKLRELQEKKAKEAEDDER